MGIRDDYKKKWAQEQANHSNHPLEFWLEIVDMFYENRTIQKLDLFIPLGNWHTDLNAFGLLSSINGTGMEIEKQQGMEKAFVFYEVCIAENFIGTHPYERLRIWYTKNKNYLDAIRVCHTYINLPDRPNGQAKDRFSHHLKILIEKLDKLKAQA